MYVYSTNLFLIKCLFCCAAVLVQLSLMPVATEPSMNL